MGFNSSVVNIHGHLMRNSMVLPIILAFIFTPTAVSSCGLFDLRSCFSGTPKALANEEVEPNSQNMTLLQAIVSPSAESTSTKKDLVIIGETSISPETFVPIENKNTVSDDQISIYVVREGDTLPAIARMFGVTVNTVRWGNDLSGNTIKVGQTLVILPISGIQHIVKKGDTLQSIAKLHKGDLDEILQYNNLAKDTKLALGDVIIVPDGEVVAVSSGGSKSTSGGKTPSYVGYYMRPIIGGVKSQGVHGHNGVDLASYHGANILASAGGDVIISRNSGYNGGYGKYIVIKHSNGTQTLYAHMSATTVNAGEHVSQGQVIGKMGNTGKSTGTHLHFEVRKGGVPVNPISYLQ